MFYLFFSSLLLNTSCNKNDVILENIEEEYDNPFSDFGIMHNKILGDLVENNNYKEKPEAKELVSFAKKISSKYVDECPNSNKEDLDIFMEEYVNKILEKPDINELIDYSYNMGYYDDEVKQKILEFKNLIIKPDQEGNVDLKEIYTRIIDFEKKIANDTTMDIDTQESLLKMTAIAKDSYHFWTENNELINSGNKNDDAVGIAAILLADATSIWCFWCSGAASFAFFLALALS